MPIILAYSKSWLTIQGFQVIQFVPFLYPGMIHSLEVNGISASWFLMILFNIWINKQAQIIKSLLAQAAIALHYEYERAVCRCWCWCRIESVWVGLCMGCLLIVSVTSEYLLSWHWNDPHAEANRITIQANCMWEMGDETHNILAPCQWVVATKYNF